MGWAHIASWREKGRGTEGGRRKEREREIHVGWDGILLLMTTCIDTVPLQRKHLDMVN